MSVLNLLFKIVCPMATIRSFSLELDWNKKRTFVVRSFSKKKEKKTILGSLWWIHMYKELDFFCWNLVKKWIFRSVSSLNFLFYSSFCHTCSKILIVSNTRQVMLNWSHRFMFLMFSRESTERILAHWINRMRYMMIVSYDHFEILSNKRIRSGNMIKVLPYSKLFVWMESVTISHMVYARNEDKN